MNMHEQFMKIAIEEAKKGSATVAPNPIVGAVIVEDDQVVATGYHERPGELHAERIALQNLGRKAKPGATMYVTLEPCSTTGRTGKCTDAIIEAGLSRVVLGAIDPNPDHCGAGIRILEEAGIEVVTGIFEEECAALNPEFNQRMQNAKNN